MTDSEITVATRWAFGTWLAATVLMLRLERAMHATGGPGIIAFELAGSEQRATAILDMWGPTGTAAARKSLWLDFGYMCSYGAFTALLSEDANRRIEQWSGIRFGPVAQVSCATAVAADACEGVALLNILRGGDRQVYAARARKAALTKFAMLSIPLALWATSRITARLSQEQTWP
ncbi:hypothetical protein [Williamsia soli]|uniref:hypothetical protein n=1 Tax=Williamsia soli TaxID=364929 RepID=UPI001A9D4704|nr:hypothetical protein [Williamsia soli]